MPQSDIIEIIPVGHAHVGPVLKLFYDENNNPINFGFVAGSVTTYSNLNPGFIMYKYDRSNNKIIDFDAYWYDLLNNNDKNVKPQWIKRQSAVKEYGLNNFSVNEWNKFNLKRTNNKTLDNLQNFNMNRGILAKYDPKSLTYIFNAIKPTIFKQLNEELTKLPASYGDCTTKSPPQPCSSQKYNQNLQYIHKSWEYKAFVRWLAGTNTGNILSMTITKKSNNYMILEVKGVFKHLSASIYIGECFTFDQCSKLWDNSQACCGTNKKFDITFEIRCNSSSPQITSITTKNINIDQFEIAEKIIGISLNVAAITDTIKDKLHDLLNKQISPANKFINLNGTKQSLTEFLQQLIIFDTNGNAIKCE